MPYENQNIQVNEPGDPVQMHTLSTLINKERFYNQIRPHQALDYLTPAEYINKYHPEVTSEKSHMY
jgi:transposase InsO family protein